MFAILAIVAGLLATIGTDHLGPVQLVPLAIVFVAAHLIWPINPFARVIA